MKWWQPAPEAAAGPSACLGRQSSLRPGQRACLQQQRVGLRFVTLTSPVATNHLFAMMLWQVQKSFLGVWKQLTHQERLPALADVGNQQDVKHGFQELTKISV